MRKKIIPLTISTLSLSLGLLIPPSVAWAEEERTYWTFDEMTTFSSEVEVEIAAACGEDPMCADMYLWNQDGDIYRALMNYNSHPLTITSINPSTGVLKAYYYNNPKYTGIPQPSNLSNLYIAQYRNGYGGAFYYDLEHGTLNPDSIQLLVEEYESVNGPGWLTQKTEVEFSTQGFSTADNAEKYLQTFYRTDNGGSVSDIAFLERCLESPDYQEGMECRVVYDRNGQFYLPFAAETLVEESANNAIDANDSQNNESNSSTGESTNENNNSLDDREGFGGLDNGITINEIASSNTNASQIGNAVIINPDSSISTPNTGVPTNQNNATEFPWWLGAIFALGVLTLVWFFWPNHKKSPKLPKKS